MAVCSFVSPWYPLKHMPVSFGGVFSSRFVASGQLVFPTTGAPFMSSPPMSVRFSTASADPSAESARVGLLRSLNDLTSVLSAPGVFRALASRR